MSGMSKAMKIPNRRFALGAFGTGSLLAAIPLCAALIGCGPSEEQKRLHRAMFELRTALHPDCRDAVQILESYRKNDKNRNEYVQYGMCETAASALGGNYAHGEEVTLETYTAVQRYQDKDAEFLAAVGNEGLKFFNGEPHERELLCYYAGVFRYSEGNLNEARMFFTQALHAARTRDSDTAEFRDDCRLAYYWLGRTLLRSGRTDEAQAAFDRAAVGLPHEGQAKEEERMRQARERQHKEELKGEKACYEQNSKGDKAVTGIADLSAEVAREAMPAALAGALAESPVVESASTLETFLSADYQGRVNLLVSVEMGVAPVKYASGPSDAYDEIKRVPYKEAAVDVYIDGHRAGSGFKLLDTYHQAVTRGVESRRGRQTTKMVLKEVAKRTPFVSLVAGYWDVGADLRFWPNLAGEYHVFAARVTPGLHTLQFKFYDLNGKYLPRYDLARHFIAVPADGDSVVTVYSLENQDNRYVLTQAVER